MASIIMYEILTTIRKHPILLTVAEIHRLSDRDTLEADAMIADGLRKCRVNNGG